MTMTIDGIYSTIGSINFDSRSMSRNAEESLSFYDRGFARKMEEMFQNDLKRCEEITYKMPEDYYAGDRDLYVTALKSQMAMYSPDGKMPKGGPEFVLSVLQQYDENVKDKQIDLSKTYTTEFVDNAR